MLRTFLMHKWFWSVTKQNFFFERFCPESNKRIFKIVTVATALVTSKLVNFSTRQTQGVCPGLPSLRYRVSPPTLRVYTDGRAGVRMMMLQPNSLISIDFQCLQQCGYAARFGRESSAIIYAKVLCSEIAQQKNQANAGYNTEVFEKHCFRVNKTLKLKALSSD